MPPVLEPAGSETLGAVTGASASAPTVHDHGAPVFCPHSAAWPGEGCHSPVLSSSSSPFLLCIAAPVSRGLRSGQGIHTCVGSGHGCRGLGRAEAPAACGSPIPAPTCSCSSPRSSFRSLRPPSPWCSPSSTSADCIIRSLRSQLCHQSWTHFLALIPAPA